MQQSAEPLRDRAIRSMGEQNFTPHGEPVHEGLWYDGRTRSLVYEGTWNGSNGEQPAEYKIYDDPREMNEEAGLKLFHEVNTSDRIRAPRLLVSHIDSAHSGWVIMEKFAEEPKEYFAPPLSDEKRKEFVDIFREYRRHFPEKNPAAESETTAVEFHTQRIVRWRALAEKADPALLNEQQDLYERAEKKVAEAFTDKKMVWGVGHVWPKKVHTMADGSIFLTNFGHMKYYPEGYELAAVIWSDAIMGPLEDGADEGVDDIQKRIDAWITDFGDDAANIKPALIERLLGSIYADTIAVDEERKPRALKEQHLAILNQLLKQLLI